jgi:hypothetical protein
MVASIQVRRRLETRSVATACHLNKSSGPSGSLPKLHLTKSQKQLHRYSLHTVTITIPVCSMALQKKLMPELCLFLHCRASRLQSMQFGLTESPCQAASTHTNRKTTNIAQMNRLQHQQRSDCDAVLWQRNLYTDISDVIVPSCHCLHSLYNQMLNI